MDLLIIKKQRNVRVQNEIGRIFKQYNILEYKSPDDGLSIDDYFKTVGYASLYIGLGETVGAVPPEEVTISLVRERYPRKMIAEMKRLGAIVERRFPGIYYVSGFHYFDTQIVVTSQLDRSLHSSLRVLSSKVKVDDVERFLTETEKLTTPGELRNADAVLQVSVSANQKIYEIVKGESNMCEALQLLLKDEIAEKVSDGERRGRIEAYMDVGMSIEDIAERLGISVEEVQDIALSMEFSQ
jgi:hypothetical protein